MKATNKCYHCEACDSVAKNEKRLVMPYSPGQNVGKVTITKECECGIKETHTELRYKTVDEDLIITVIEPLDKLIFRSEFLDKVFESNKELFNQYVQELEKKIFEK